MKLPVFRLQLACLAAMWLFAGLQTVAQPLTLESFTIGGGGDFTLVGAIGQPDAGTMSGGSYALAGGFWGGIQTPPPVSTVMEAWVVNGEVHLRFNGIPGRIYEIERASFVNGPWRHNDQPFAVVTMSSGGVVEFVDTTAISASQSFYRTSMR